MSLTLTAPLAGATLYGSISLQGSATNYVNGIALPAQSFSIGVDTTQLGNGPQTLSATDLAGESANVSVLVANESQSGSTLTSPSGYLADSAHNLFNLVSVPNNGNVVYLNGSPAAFTQNVTLLLYYGGAIYQMNVANNWWVWQAGAWVAAADPRPKHVTLYGVNGHITWTFSSPSSACYEKPNWPNAIAAMQDLGAKTYRNGFAVSYDAQGNIIGSDLDTFKDFINNYATPAGIVVTPVALPNFDPNGTATEASAYTVGYNFGVVLAGLKGLVPHYEVGNEYDSYAIIDGSHTGNYPGDFDNRRFTVVRGCILGLIAGIRSIDPTTPIASPGGTWLHTALLDMLSTGTQPDGSSGHPVVSWDVTCWHWYINNYAPNDDPENSQGNFNLLAKLASFGKPIHINECGANYSAYGSANVANAIVGNYLIGRFYAVRNTYGIANITYYQLYDAAGPGTPSTDNEMNFGLIQNDGTTHKGRYATLKTFIAGHQ